MALELKQQVRLSQQLVMTPQLQQAIKLLQLSRMELVGLVQKELQENPVLEETNDGDEERLVAEQVEPSEVSPAEAADAAEVAELAGPSSAEALPGSEGGESGEGEREPTEAEKIADVDWQNYLDANPHTGMRESGGEDDRPSFESTLTRRETLGEHLLWQLQLVSLPVEHEVAARFIVGNIDERGYLQSSV